MSLLETQIGPANEWVLGKLGWPLPRERMAETSMPREPTRCRIAMLTFDEPPRLWRAADDLFLNGIGACQLCLFGLPQVLADSDPAQLQTPLALSEDFRQTFRCVIWRPSVIVRISEATTIEMKCGTRASDLFTPVAESVFEARWLKPDMRHSLANDVATGAVVLLVASNTAEQQALGARLLLRHGNRDLQTHEFSQPH